jgi:hypothetical protein
MALWAKAILCVKSSLLEQSLPRTPNWQIRSLPTYQVGQRNLWLINDLRLFTVFYTCRETITDVMSALQIHLFMQNKPNFRKSQMNINEVLTTDYDKMDTWSIEKNKANSNPIQTQFKANTKPIKAKTKPNKPNSNPIQTQYKANSNPIKAKTNPKQTQYKPNLSRRSLWRSLNKPNFRANMSSWGTNDRTEQSAIQHNNVFNICRLTWEFIGSTISELIF